MLEPTQIDTLRQTPVPESGNRVAIAVGLLGKTQREVARDLGMTDAQLSDVCRGRFRDQRLSTAQRFAGYFGCQVEDLFPSRQAVA